jgi:hypothetical protein
MKSLLWDFACNITSGTERSLASSSSVIFQQKPKRSIHQSRRVVRDTEMASCLCGLAHSFQLSQALSCCLSERLTTTSQVLPKCIINICALSSSRRSKKNDVVFRLLGFNAKFASLVARAPMAPGKPSRLRSIRVLHMTSQTQDHEALVLD